MNPTLRILRLATLRAQIANGRRLLAYLREQELAHFATDEGNFVEMHNRAEAARQWINDRHAELNHLLTSA